MPGLIGLLAAIAVAGALAILAPAASAQPLAFSASYVGKATGRNGTPTCPANEIVCGAGTSQFGGFTYALVFGPGEVNFVTLTFKDGTLVLDEIFDPSLSSTPGNSGDSHESPGAFGNPNIIYSNWTVDTVDSTGVFSGLSGGTGTDILHFAGLAGRGTINGTLTPSS
jgi:hypothetical protein